MYVHLYHSPFFPVIFLYTLPISGKLYLFMQPDPQYLPFTFVPPGQNDSQLSELESCIKSTFNPVDIFVNQLLH